MALAAMLHATQMLQLKAAAVKFTCSLALTGPLGGRSRSIMVDKQLALPAGVSQI